MKLHSPRLIRTAIITDDAELAAQFTCALAERGAYLPILDGPRITRPDAAAEIVRRNNALARLHADRIILTGLDTDVAAAMTGRLPQRRIRHCTAEDVRSLAQTSKVEREPLRWGRAHIGAGVLQSLYAGKLIEFRDDAEVTTSVIGRSDHLVVCEAGVPLAEVIAANYAFALGASMQIIPEVPRTIAESILEEYYSIDQGPDSQAEIRDRLQIQLRDLCGDLKLPVGGSVTFFTRKIPFGVAFPHIPTTHLFNYPDLGLAVANGFSAEQDGTRGVNVAVLVDPAKTHAPEIEAATKILADRTMLVRGYRGPGADVRTITDMVDHFPYDLLIFATHCGDTSGYRWTYEFTDSEGIDRKLVVDVAIGIGRTNDPDILDVMQMNSFHSLDGVDWGDSVAKANLYVGKAITDYAERVRKGDLEPVLKETIDRVRRSSVMAMYDHNYLPAPQSIADNGTPIIINNACLSWHELAGRFMFANTRAYIGTLYPVTDGEAEGVVIKLLDKFWGKSLPHALWSAQNAVYGSTGNRRPYIMTGVYPQRLRTTREKVPVYVFRRLVAGLRDWRGRLEKAKSNPELVKRIEPIVDFYVREINSMKRRWFS